MKTGLLLAAAVVFAMSSRPDHAEAATVTHQILEFSDLQGWESDDHGAALQAFLNTCGDLDDPDWTALCRMARETTDAKSFFELMFRPVFMTTGRDALFTGYFEPELDGALQKSERYKYPIYSMPPEARAGRWKTRREIVQDAVLEGRGLEIVWVDDPVELFFLQVQGSGRVRLPNGDVIRIGYGGANGHPYRSIGQELIRKGVYEPHQVSAEVIKNWVKRNPEEGEELLYHNPSYVFFREVNEVPADKGPLGAMNRSVTTLRTIAVDPAYVPLGSPVWIEKSGTPEMHRLMIAQDTGSAIKGAQRADIFMGTGDAAGRAAGRIRNAGRMVVLLPIQRAYALLPESVE